MTRIYAATSSHFALLSSSGTGFEVDITLKDAGIQCLAVDPRDSGVVYAGSRGQGIFASVDGGMNWTALDFPERDVFALAVSRADGALYAGTEPSKLFVSRDQGGSWREIEALQAIPSRPSWSFPPRPHTSHVRWIAPNPHDADLLLVGIELGGVMRTADGGRTWRDHPRGAIADCHALAWHESAVGQAYEVGGGGPAARSKDGGLTWETMTAGTELTYGWALAVDPDDADVWYMSASPSARHAHRLDEAQARIYRSADGSPWVAVTAEPLTAMPYGLAVSAGVLYAGMSDGSLLASNDAGESWRDVPMVGDKLDRIRAMVVV